MKHYSQCIYLDWHELDALVQKWAEENFGGHIKSDTERDDTDWEIMLTNQRPEDKGLFFRLFEGQEDFSAEEEWQENAALLIPTVVSNRIASSFLEMESVDKTMASYKGVLFLPKADGE
ncbi:MAG: hypothetical protein IJA20_09735 [Methanocorpusculum sp.]|nr:hypothetical protein [Oscillospiraceae bacterium]MBQ3570936.1 hypothetical protein [Methanocorpusculum sp.]